MAIIVTSHGYVAHVDVPAHPPSSTSQTFFADYDLRRKVTFGLVDRIVQPSTCAASLRRVSSMPARLWAIRSDTPLAGPPSFLASQPR